MPLSAGETATVEQHGKSRPCIVLEISRDGKFATIAIGSTIEKEHEHITIMNNSLEAKQMSLRHTTHFYINKIFVTDLANLTPVTRKTRCPRHVFAQLIDMARRKTNSTDGRYTGNYLGHFGSYETTQNTHQNQSKPLTSSLGDLLKNKFRR
jgi:hypothetical protein